ncbi:MAG: cadherin-like beta sandwich domain-containing protein [Lachnospiraceae bacterium]
MNRKLKQWVCGLLMAFLMAAVLPFQMIDSYAATARISFSDPSTKVGQTFTVKMKFTCTSGEMLGDTKVMLDYDASMLEFISEADNPSGGAGKISVRSGLDGKTEVATELKFKALQAGTTAITIADWDGYDNDGQALTMEREGSSTIKIEGLPTSSNDASLQSLQISPGTLEPAFAPEVDVYTTSVGLDVDKLTVSARANNDKAAVTVEGAAQLAEGENTVTCQITAEDGTTVKTYTITVNKVVGGASEAGEAGENDGDGEAQTPQPEVLAELRSAAKTLRIVDLPDGVTAPVSFKERSITIGDKTVTGWILEGISDTQYCLFYALNEDGEAGFYSYDLNPSEQTIQRYFANADIDKLTETIKKLEATHNDLIDDYNKTRYISFGLMGAVALMTIIIIVLLTRKNRGSSSTLETEPRTVSEPVVRHSRGRKLTKEDRYMIGEEDTYDDEIPPSKIEVIADDDAEFVPATDNLEQVIADDLAKEAAAALEDDFEFFDLDDEE